LGIGKGERGMKDVTGQGGIGRGREGNGEGGSGMEGRVGKGKGGLDLDICPGAPEFLVTPLHRRPDMLATG